MSNKQQFMILKPSPDGGCVPEPEDWATQKMAKVVIVNATGEDQELTNISTRLLKSPGGSWLDEITIPAWGFWQGKVGNVRNRPGEYTYQYGSPTAAPREGTIDPS